MRTSCLLLKSLVYDICYILSDMASLDILLFYFTVHLPHIFKYEIMGILLSLSKIVPAPSNLNYISNN